MTSLAIISAVTAVSVTIAGGTATALMVGGEHTGPPAPIKTPTVGYAAPGFIAQNFAWDKSPDATGYRIYLDGKVAGLVNYNGSMLSITCGVQHRFNAQPFNNKGFAKLAPPVYVTAPCDLATK